MSTVLFWHRGNTETFKRRRETEIKHGRVAMYATMGCLAMLRHAWPRQAPLVGRSRSAVWTYVWTVEWLVTCLCRECNKFRNVGLKLIVWIGRIIYSWFCQGVNNDPLKIPYHLTGYMHVRHFYWLTLSNSAPKRSSWVAELVFSHISLQE